MLRTILLIGSVWSWFWSILDCQPTQKKVFSLRLYQQIAQGDLIKTSSGKEGSWGSISFSSSNMSAYDEHYCFCSTDRRTRYILISRQKTIHHLINTRNDKLSLKDHTLGSYFIFAFEKCITVCPKRSINWRWPDPNAQLKMTRSQRSRPDKTKGEKPYIIWLILLVLIKLSTARY